MIEITHMPTVSSLAAALNERRLLMMWADVVFPPEERTLSSHERDATIDRWQEAAPALPFLPFEFEHGKPWPLARLPGLSILSLDPTDRLEKTFRYAGVPLQVMRTRDDRPARDQHSLLKLGGDLTARAGLWPSWEEVRHGPDDPDKAHLLQQASQRAQDGGVLVIAPVAGDGLERRLAVFARVWEEVLTAPLSGAAHHVVVGPGGYPWPAPLKWLGMDVAQVLGALADASIPPPLEPAPLEGR